jgi:hypothetical protein
MTPKKPKIISAQTESRGLILYVFQKYLSRHTVSLNKCSFYPVQTLRSNFSFDVFCDFIICLN